MILQSISILSILGSQQGPGEEKALVKEDIILPPENNCFGYFKLGEIEALAANRIAQSSLSKTQDDGADGATAVMEDPLETIPIICQEFCGVIILHTNEVRMADEMNVNIQAIEDERSCIENPPKEEEKEGAEPKKEEAASFAEGAKKEKKSCKIQNYCSSEICTGFQQVCASVLKREKCSVKTLNSKDPVDLDCFIHMHAHQDSLKDLDDKKVHHMINQVGLKAYKNEVQKQKESCLTLGINEDDQLLCSFDVAFEVEIKHHLRDWYAHRAYIECVRVNEKSPEWMNPKLNCAMCMGHSDDGAKCDINQIIQRQLRLSYHKVRFLELLELYHSRWGRDIGAYEWVMSQTNFEPRRDKRRCFIKYFQWSEEGLEETKVEEGIKQEKEVIPERRCFRILAGLLAESLSIDNGDWYRENVALKLFSTFFWSDNEEPLPMTEDVQMVEIHRALEAAEADILREDSQERHRSYIQFRERQQARGEREGDKKKEGGDAAAAEDPEKAPAEVALIQDGEANSNQEDFTERDLNSILEFVSNAGKEIQRVVPFSYQDDFSRQAIYYTHNFLSRAIKVRKTPPAIADSRIILRDAKIALRDFEERMTGLAADFDFKNKEGGAEGGDGATAEEGGAAPSLAEGAAGNNQVSTSGLTKEQLDQERFFECEISFYDRFLGGRAIIRAARKLATLTAEKQKEVVKKVGFKFDTKKWSVCIPDKDSKWQPKFKEKITRIQKLTEKLANGLTHIPQEGEKKEEGGAAAEPEAKVDDGLMKTEDHHKKNDDKHAEHNKNHVGETVLEMEHVDKEESLLVKGNGKSAHHKINGKTAIHVNAKGHGISQKVSLIQGENEAALDGNLPPEGEATADGAAAGAGGDFAGIEDAPYDYVKRIIEKRLATTLEGMLDKLRADFFRSKQRAGLSPTSGKDPRNDGEGREIGNFDQTLSATKNMLGHYFEWFEFLEDSAHWKFDFFQDMNDAGLEYRRAEMGYIRRLCKAFRIDPDLTFFPVDIHHPNTHSSKEYDALSGNYDKQECSMQHILARQYALLGLLQYDDGTRFKVEEKKKEEVAHRVWSTETIGTDGEAENLKDPVHLLVDEQINKFNKDMSEESKDEALSPDQTQEKMDEEEINLSQNKDGSMAKEEEGGTQSLSITFLMLMLF